MTTPTADDAADLLYAGLPADFTAHRDELVRVARGAGKRDQAAAIAALRKPTVAAWLVNRLARERSDDVGAFTELGAALREAEAALQGADLRRLGQQRHDLVRALVAYARSLAQAAGQQVGEATLRDVEATLRAALADEAAAELVRAGRLTTALDPSGFGGRGDTADPDAAAPVRRGSAASDMASRQRDRRQPTGRQHGGRQRAGRQQGGAQELAHREQDRQRLADELSAAWAQAGAAAESRESAAAARKEARTRRDGSRRELRALQERLAALEREIGQAQAAADEADQQAELADREAAEASAAADEARAHVRDLQRRLDHL